MTQPFLHAGQHRHIVSGLDMDYPVRPQARLLKPRCKQVRLRHAPKDLSRQPCGNASGKAGGCGPVHRTIAATRHLVQAAERQPATGQAAVQIGKAKGQHPAGWSTVTLHPRDLLAQGSDGGIEGSGGHGRKELPRG